MQVKLIHYLDASAAKGAIMRKGAGRIKHLEVRQLWGQYVVERFGVTVVKIPRKDNVSDTLTHAVSRKAMDWFMDFVKTEFVNEP